MFMVFTKLCHFIFLSCLKFTKLIDLISVLYRMSHRLFPRTIYWIDNYWTIMFFLSLSFLCWPYQCKTSFWPPSTVYISVNSYTHELFILWRSLYIWLILVFTQMDTFNLSLSLWLICKPWLKISPPPHTHTNESC